MSHFCAGFSEATARAPNCLVYFTLTKKEPLCQGTLGGVYFLNNVWAVLDTRRARSFMFCWALRERYWGVYTLADFDFVFV